MSQTVDQHQTNIVDTSFLPDFIWAQKYDFCYVQLFENGITFFIFKTLKSVPISNERKILRKMAADDISKHMIP